MKEMNSLERSKKEIQPNIEGQQSIENLAFKLNEVHSILIKDYLQDLQVAEIVPFNKEYPSDRKRGLRWFRIDRIVYEEGTFFIDRFAMLISALHGEARELVLLIRKEKGGNIQLFLGSSDVDEHNMYYAGETLRASLEGIFPGIQYEQKNPRDLLDFDNKAVASVSVIGSLRDENKQNFAQGLERLINATASVPDFTALMIAERVSESERQSLISGYTQMHSMLSPLMNVQITRNKEESVNFTEGESQSIGYTLSKGVSRTIAHGNTASKSINKTEGNSNTGSTSRTRNYGGIIGGGASAIGTIVGTALLPGVGTVVGGAIGGAIGTTVGSFFGSNTKSESKTSTESNTTGHTSGTSRTESDATTENKSESNTKSTNSSTSKTMGSGESYAITLENKAVSHLLQQIDGQIERIDAFSALGMWNSATYIAASTTTDVRRLANIYKGCVLGDESNFETTAVNTWPKEQQEEVNALSKYLSSCVHPRFIVGQGYNVSAGTLVNSKDLAIHMALPQSSVPGVLVQKRASFGREVHASYLPDKPISLGNIFHLGITEKTPVCLDGALFSKHVFVTGSTGSGKSNTVYHLLNSAVQFNEISTLVIEPAKGEYRHVFPDAKVYGTNPTLSELLRLNPFAFPKEIRVDEHVDRLVEIFNVCWPMYAAMPAVLKDSILRAYESCGWDLLLSTPKYKGLFPSFADVLRELNTVIRTSSYSSDTQGDYIGSLETRLRSLTNGINSLIFTNSHCVEDSDLFDKNVIVDLSRLGSTETRSLIMGILVMKLSEYRISQAQGRMNQPLRHITVLEEAHHLLKKTSKEQSSEGSNLVGKSVEMIANAIAEMRTYGEGFILADQSPSALDDSAIKNTNTKIIMSLPDGDDRIIAGKSVGLDEEQIDEIAKLPVGVGVVFQNGWSEAVLCKIEEYKTSNPAVNYSMGRVSTHHDDKVNIDTRIVSMLLRNSVEPISMDMLEGNIMQSHLTGKHKLQLLDISEDYQKMNLLEYRNKWPSRMRAVILSEYLNVDHKVGIICSKYHSLGLTDVMDKIRRVIPRAALSEGIVENHIADYLLLAETLNSQEGNELYQKWAKSLKNSML